MINIMKLIMPSSNMITILVLISTFIFISLSNSEASTDYRAHVCPNTTIFNPNTTYKSNLDRVLSFLVTNSSIRDTLYHNTSVGRNPGTIVYGSFLCRGDISSEECKDCVQTATRALTQLYCPVEKEAVIWYNNCIVRYSNVSFFGKIADEPEITTWTESRVMEPERFNRLLENTMTELVTKASNATIGDKKFAVKKENYTEFQSLYCLLECSPDLSGLDCNRCLKSQVAQLPTCCAGKEGGNGYNPSCYIRFEVFPFYNEMSSSIPFPPPASQGKNVVNFIPITNHYC